MGESIGKISFKNEISKGLLSSSPKSLLNPKSVSGSINTSVFARMFYPFMVFADLIILAMAKALLLEVP